METIIYQILGFFLGSGLISFLTLRITKARDRAYMLQEIERAKQEGIKTETSKIEALSHDVNVYSALIDNLDTRCVYLVEKLNESESRYIELEKKYTELKKIYNDLLKKTKREKI
jgi:chromosome segregation ATPase